LTPHNGIPNLVLLPQIPPMTATLKNEQGQKTSQIKKKASIWQKKKTMARKNSSTNKPKKK